MVSEFSDRILLYGFRNTLIISYVFIINVIFRVCRILRLTLKLYRVNGNTVGKKIDIIG